MTAGIEYEATPISDASFQIGDTEVWFTLGHSSMTMNGDHGWIIIATSSSADSIEFYSSESSLENRPKISIQYTDVHSVSISPAGSTTDADTQVQFSHILNDALGGMVAEDVEWSASDGSIDYSGLFTPEYVGLHNITACFGVICTTESITVTPGAADILVVEDRLETITADESFTIVAVIHDQHGNIVPGLTITYTPSNGTMTGTTFFPHTSGSQTVLVEWWEQSIYAVSYTHLTLPTKA